jgi:ParB family chromosome partitioning protein
MKINISQIKINKGRRSVDLEKVKQLSESIQEIGLLNPVTITTNNVLIAGAHRIEAIKLLGEKEIEINIIDVSGLKAELAEIDENIVRNELHYITRGEQLERRKVIYEELHPETRRGISQAAGMNKAIGRNVSAESAMTFTQDTAAKTGVSSRVIHEEIQIAKNLKPEVKEAIIKSDISKTDALKIARLKPEQQVTALNTMQGIKDKPHISQATGNNEWYTPPEYVEAARKVLGAIDLDPASNAEANKIIKAERFFIAEDDGLNKNWKGRVWLNPPYASNLIVHFALKLKNHYERNKVTEAVVLVNNATETAWFNTLIGIASAVVFPKTG